MQGRCAAPVLSRPSADKQITCKRLVLRGRRPGLGASLLSHVAGVAGLASSGTFGGYRKPPLLLPPLLMPWLLLLRLLLCPLLLPWLP